MHEPIEVSQHEAVEALTECVLTLLNKLESKDDVKTVLRSISPRNVRIIAEAALPREYYEICQAAREVQLEACQ